MEHHGGDDDRIGIVPYRIGIDGSIAGLHGYISFVLCYQPRALDNL